MEIYQRDMIWISFMRYIKTQDVQRLESSIFSLAQAEFSSSTQWLCLRRLSRPVVGRPRDRQAQRLQLQRLSAGGGAISSVGQEETVSRGRGLHPRPPTHTARHCHGQWRLDEGGCLSASGDKHATALVASLSVCVFFISCIVIASNKILNG
ncbi:unnamed protein product [Acanthoscelides obtectus]|uniref:Uncharacterized protein n=1 Tax=Acanthoscelides obtectus TaxID=200917 RepID=A0A9P0KGA9_ACAOB|nr:unnamed protein product [Acanthoscelides obtectus]CAK1648178.1 hypothetical protein AOBTE_LOCUS15585 [Acanthoscelides obtectus]